MKIAAGEIIELEMQENNSSPFIDRSSNYQKTTTFYLNFFNLATKAMLEHNWQIN